MDDSKIKMQVIMLPTEKATANNLVLALSEYGWANRDKLYLINKIDGEILHYTDKVSYMSGGAKELLDKIFQPQNLYFCSDREIKEGEYRWVYNIGQDRVYKINPVDKKIDTERIIYASTDESLGLPRPRLDFLEAYVKLQASIKEVMVEMEEVGTGNFGEYKGSGFEYIKKKVRTRPDNTIIISKVEETWDDIFEAYEVYYKKALNLKETYYPFPGWVKRNYSPPTKLK